MSDLSVAEAVRMLAQEKRANFNALARGATFWPWQSGARFAGVEDPYARAMEERDRRARSIMHWVAAQNLQRQQSGQLAGPPRASKSPAAEPAALPRPKPSPEVEAKAQSAIKARDKSVPGDKPPKPLSREEGSWRYR